MRNFNFKFLIFNVKLFSSKFKIQNSKLPRSGFSMVELIFVIVLLGILASIGGNLLPDNRLLNDTNYIVMKIKETQKNAIGNDINGFETPWSKESNSTCIYLSKNRLEKRDLKSQKPHKLSPNLNLSVDGNKTLCFDEFGRPYDSSMEQLLPNEINITVKYNDNNKTISIQPMSGYVIIYNE